MYKVLVRSEVRDKVPCQFVYTYSLDNGKSWISHKEYYDWRQAKIKELFAEIPEYQK